MTDKKEYMKEYHKAHYAKNREKILSQNKIYQAAHKEQKKAYDKKRRESIKDKLNEYDRLRYEKDYFGCNRNKALERDNYSCRLCSSAEQLVVHHLDETGKMMEGRIEARKSTNNELSNLQTLCRSCHMKIHRHKIANAREMYNRAYC